MADRKKIVIVTTSQPAANPRTVKEATALSEAGYAVMVVYTVTLPWADTLDKKILLSNQSIQWVQAGKSLYAHKWYYRYVRLRRKFNETGYKIGLKSLFADFASVLLGQELFRTVKKQRADLLIAHNLGALPVVSKLAQKFNIPFVFDAEDFHRGEAKENSFHWKYSKFLEDKYFPSLCYLTASSPLIAATYKRLYPWLSISTILNVFQLSHLNGVNNAVSGTIKLFWFSQSVGKGRGLEDVIKAMDLLPEGKFSLTLLGNCTNEMKHYFKGLLKENRNDIFFLDPVAPDEIFRIAGTFDVGMALEPGRDSNNQQALSNKIFTYLLSGNAIIFSNTPAQQSFYNQHSTIGFSYHSGDVNDLAEKLLMYLQFPDMLREHKRNAIQLTKEMYNWDMEKRKLLKLIDEIFTKSNQKTIK